jgi:hypothetical protein
MYLIVAVSNPVLGPTQPPAYDILSALSPWVKRLNRQPHHSGPSVVEVKNE